MWSEQKTPAQPQPGGEHITRDGAVESEKPGGAAVESEKPRGAAVESEKAGRAAVERGANGYREDVIQQLTSRLLAELQELEQWVIRFVQCRPSGAQGNAFDSNKGSNEVNAETVSAEDLSIEGASLSPSCHAPPSDPPFKSEAHSESEKSTTSNTRVLETATTTTTTTTTTESNADEQFINRIRVCIVSTQQLASHTAETLESQDAEISTLKEQLLSNRHSRQTVRTHRPVGAASEFRHPPAGTATGLPSCEGPPVVPSLALDTLPNQSDARLPPESVIVPIDQQLDTLLDRVHLLLASGGATYREDGHRLLTRRGGDESSGGVSSSGTIGWQTDAMRSEDFQENRKAGEGINTIQEQTPDDALAALRRQADRIKDEIWAYSNCQPTSKPEVARSESPQVGVRTDDTDGSSSRSQLGGAANTNMNSVNSGSDEDADRTMRQKQLYQRSQHEGSGSSESPASSNRVHRKISLQEAKLKASFLEEMQQGSWFFRVGRKFGAIGKALKSTFCKRSFVWISYDFKNLYCSANEPAAAQPSTTFSASGRRGGKELVVVIPLHNVVGFVYGEGSRAYRVQENRGACQPAHLCFSLWTKRQSLDLIALNEQEVKRWYLGLNSLLPFFPGRTFLTPSEFNKAKENLKMENFKRERSRVDSSEEIEPYGGDVHHHFAHLYNPQDHHHASAN